MEASRRRVTGAATIVLGAAMTLAACGSGSDDDAPAAAVTATAAPSSSSGPEDGGSTIGAVESYRAWLKQSRAPDADAACARLAPKLVTRMLAELNAASPVKARTCQEMITATAALYKATGQSADVDISVREETQTDATLFVTYSSGDCGTVVMKRAAADWVITEQSQECAR